MDAKVKKLWVKELRSGKWKQTTTCLSRGDNRRCCLGVLCEIALRKGIIHSYQADAGWLPSLVVRWAGLDRADGDETVIGRTARSLVRHNDLGRRTFAQIADAIEEQL